MNKKLLLLSLTVAACTLQASAIGTSGRAGEAAAGDDDIITPPYTLNLKSETERARYTIIDANGDGNTWVGYSFAFRCYTQGELPADDWLVSPGIALTQGSTYTITFKGHNRQSDKPEVYTLLAGSKPEAAALTDTVAPTVTFTAVETEEYTTTYRAPSTGVYYFGFHCTSPAASASAYLEAWSISAPAGKASPDSVTALQVTAGARGQMSATIAFTTPVKNADGSALTQIATATVTNLTTGNTVATLTAPQAGTPLSVTDQAPVNGNNKYRVVCASAAGEGIPAEASAYVGIDTPLPVGRGNWTQQGTKAVLTWPAVSTTGVHGGYVNPDEVTYKIAMMSPEPQVIATGVKGTTYTDATLATLQGQTFLYYAVYPVSKAGTGGGSPTFSGTFGTPFATPATESFAGAQLTHSPWYVVDYAGDENSSWDIVAQSTSPAMQPQDSDGGMAVMHTADDGDHMLTSPMFALGSAVSQLKFYVNNYAFDNRLRVFISDDRGHSWTQLHEVGMTGKTWEERTVDLADYAGKTVNIGFRGEVLAYNNPIMLDNISIATTQSGITATTTAPQLRLDGRTLTAPAQQHRLTVYSTSGHTVATVAPGQPVDVTLAPGIYLVRTGAVTTKLAVR